MFCATCGKEMPGGANFCPSCGNQPANAPNSRSIGQILNSMAVGIGDLNDDGKVDSEDLKIAAQKTKNFVSDVGDKFSQSEMAKGAAKGAVAGAVITGPILPFIGPIIGAKVGAVYGAISNMGKKGEQSSPQKQTNQVETESNDVIEKIRKLNGLKKDGIITEEEFQQNKCQLLKKL